MRDNQGIIGRTKTAIKGLFRGDDAPGIEFASEEKEFRDFVITTYNEAFESIAGRSKTWQENRAAYLGETHDHYGGEATIDIDGETGALFCSAVVADKVEDLVSIQLQSRPEVYPLPRVKSDWLEIGPDVTPFDSPSAYAKRVWEKVIEDVRERRKIKKKYIQLAKDARLCNICIVEIYQKYDHELQQEDVDFNIVQPEDFVWDPAEPEFENAEYAYRRMFKTPYQLIQAFPKKKDEILAAVIDEENTKIKRGDISRGSGNDDKKRFKHRVEVAVGYFRSLETKTEPRAVTKTDAVTGEPYEDTEKIEVLKYPNGRRVTFLPGSEVILEDVENTVPFFPFAVYCPQPVSWNGYGRNEASPLRNLQHLDDRVWQQADINLRRNANGKLFYEKGALSDGITNEIGESVEVARVGAVYYHQAKNVASDALMMHGTIQNDADQISGVHAPAQGKPASLTSGKAIGMLQTASNRKVMGSADMFAEFLQDMWKKACHIIYDTYRAGRLLRVSDDDGIPEELRYSLFEMTAAPPDVKTGSDSSFMVDEISRFQLYMNLMQVRDHTGVSPVDNEFLIDNLPLPGGQELKRRIKAAQTAQTMQGAQGATQQNADLGRALGGNGAGPAPPGMGGPKAASPMMGAAMEAMQR